MITTHTASAGYPTEYQLIDILLIEDNEDHVELIRQTLEDAHIANKIIHFERGEEALSYLGANDTPSGRLPGVILLDLNLPGMSGHDFLKHIRNDERLKSIPVVVLTTSAGEADRAIAYENYVNSYLIKPIDGDQFERMVNDLGMYWGIWNKLRQDGERGNRSGP